MFFLRAVGNDTRWATNGGDRAAAIASDLTDRRGGRLSVFRVTEEHFWQRIFALYAMGTKDKPETICCVLVPDDVFPACGLQLERNDCDIDHPLLHQTHHEVIGLDDDATRGRLFDAARGRAVGRRLTKSDFKELVLAELADPLWGPSARSLILGKQKWLALTAPP